MTYFHIMRDHKPSATADVRRPPSATIPCGCGCGEMIPATDHLGRPRKYVKGHVARVTVRDLWSEDRKNKFREMWLAGRTCREIAFELGMPRNSCPGRAERMGLPSRGSPLRAALNLTPEQRKARRRERDSKRHKSNSAPRPVKAHTAPNANRKLVRRVPRVMVDIGPSRNLPIGDLKPNECRYPTSEGRDHLFCGCKAETGKPYCAGHMSIATIPNQHLELEAA